MPRQELQETLSYARLSQLYRYGRRALGLPAARKDDFIVTLPPGEAARLQAIATAVRGPAAPPAIFVHGVLPRSGTNFLVDALALHPHVHAHPGRLWSSRYCTSRPVPRPCSASSSLCSAAMRR